MGQQSAPTENKGIDAQVVGTIDLGPDMPNYQLRLRKITFEAGGVAALHSHKDRPAFTYVLDGTVTELRDGGYKKEYGPGDVITESRDVTHWAENKGTTKAVLAVSPTPLPHSPGPGRSVSAKVAIVNLSTATASVSFAPQGSDRLKAST